MSPLTAGGARRRKPPLQAAPDPPTDAGTGHHCRPRASTGIPEPPQTVPGHAGWSGPPAAPQIPPRSFSAPGNAERRPPGRRRMKYATAICQTVQSSAGLRTGNQPHATRLLAERTRAAIRALVVQRRPRPQVTQCPSAPSSCCLSNARQAAASRHASAPAREGIPEAPEGSRPRSGTVVPRTPRKYFCTPSAKRPNSTASTPGSPSVELVFDYGVSSTGGVRRFRRRSRRSPPGSPGRVGAS